MGALTSRQNAGVEEVDIVSNHAYKYPPRSGNYFGSHFIMGGERFDTPQPEAYLFGENADLNFLGSKPTPFPYPPPQTNEPTKTLKSLVNIRKESMKFVKAAETLRKGDQEDTDNIKSSKFNIEFTFDADAKCAITLYYFCVEDFGANGVSYTSRDSTLTSETFHYKRGANQQFSQPMHVFDPSNFTDEELCYNTEKEIIPIAIHCMVEEGTEEPRQSHTTIAVVEKHSDGSYVLKALKQKLFVDGLCYLLQEIYGIENKNNDGKGISGDDDLEDNGSECVICMCDVRDTLILPCRHLCLCNSCADSLRYQANNCPICRAPFRALLQIRALQRTANSAPANQPTDGSCENIPAGYEAVSLIEALNGPCVIRPVMPVVTCDPESPDTEVATQAAEVLNRSNLDRTSNGRQGSPRLTENKENRHNNSSQVTPEFRMSVLLSRDEQNMNESTSTQSLLQNQNNVKSLNKLTSQKRDAVKHINEKNNIDQDTDSEAEKLSPLLDAATMTSAEILPLHIDGVVEPIDDTDTDLEDIDIVKSPTKSNKPPMMQHRNSRPALTDGETVALAAGEDSDYYTPEDPQTTILSPLYGDKDSPNFVLPGTSPAPASTEGTPQRWNCALRHDTLTSLPGTPLSNNSHISHTSNRSSADSYSSSSSTRHLLAVAPAPVVTVAASTNNGGQESTVQI